MQQEAAHEQLEFKGKMGTGSTDPGHAGLAFRGRRTENQKKIPFVS